MNEVFFGDCRDTMKRLIAEGVKVNCIVTSPPYWGLRDYGIPPSIWGGDPACDHRWVTSIRPGKTGGNSEMQELKGAVNFQAFGPSECGACGAWKGCLGLEPDFRMFITHMVEVFDLARELLTDDGVCWVNMGDSYATGVAGGGNNPSNKSTLSTSNGKGPKPGDKYHTDQRGKPFRTIHGLKQKDMCLIPDRLGIALQDAGWWVRSKLPWIKRNGMPESTTDRPAQSVEYVFMLTKKARYFYDHEAVKVKSSPATHDRLSQVNLENQAGSARGNGGMKHNGPMRAVGQKPHLPGNKTHKGTTAYENGDERMQTKAGLVVYADKMRKLAEAGSGVKNNDSMDEALAVMPSQRNFRVTDLFFQSWQGLWTDGDGEPLALIVNTYGFSARSLHGVSDDSRRITSPDCPIHVVKNFVESKARRDARLAASLSARNQRIDGHLDLLPHHELFSTVQPVSENASHGNSDSLPLTCSETAIAHNMQNCKTGHAHSTLPHVVTGAESRCHTADSGLPLDSSATDGRILENNTAQDCGAGEPEKDRVAGILSDSACTCTYKKIIDHFAVFPPDLIKPLILAATSAHGHCQKCGAGWTRVTTKGKPDLAHQQACGGDVDGEYHGEAVKEYAGTGAQDASEVKARILEGMRESITAGWKPTCRCNADCVPAVVFDPFMGSGTTGSVAQSFGRNWLGCDMNEAYKPMQDNRTRQMGLPV